MPKFKQIFLEKLNETTKFQKVHEISVKDAIKYEYIEKYYNRGYKQNFWKNRWNDGFKTAVEALGDYLKKSKEQEKRQDKEIAKDKEKRIKNKEVLVAVWDKKNNKVIAKLPTGDVEMTVGNFRSKFWDWEDEFGKEFVHYDIGDNIPKIEF